MDAESEKLTVFFEEPFWIGVFERTENGKLSVCKVTFGAEPKDYDIWEFILKNYYKLKFSSNVETKIKQTANNPKRRQRNIRKQLQTSGIGTKSQQALQTQRELTKIETKQLHKKQRELEKQHQFDLKQKKRKEKHKGR